MSEKKRAVKVEAEIREPGLYLHTEAAEGSLPDGTKIRVVIPMPTKSVIVQFREGPSLDLDVAIPVSAIVEAALAARAAELEARERAAFGSVLEARRDPGEQIAAELEQADFFFHGHGSGAERAWQDGGIALGRALGLALPWLRALEARAETAERRLHQLEAEGADR